MKKMNKDLFNNVFDLDLCKGECDITIGRTPLQGTQIGKSVCSCRNTCHRYLATQSPYRPEFAYFCDPMRCILNGFSLYKRAEQRFVNNCNTNV